MDVLTSSRIYLVTQSKFYQLLIVLAIHFINKYTSIACIINWRCMCRIFIAKNFELSNYSFHGINFGYFWSLLNINNYPNYHLRTMDFTYLDGHLTIYKGFKNLEFSIYNFHGINFGYFWSPININNYPNYQLHTMDFTYLDSHLTTYKGFNYSFHLINFGYFWSSININHFLNYNLHTMDFIFLDGRHITYKGFKNFEF